MVLAEQIIRDPVHDVIAFRMDNSLDSLLFSLLNTAEFQRLRRVRQLGMASLAYPGADHSRYSHCVGVMQTARKFLNQFSLDFTITDEQRTIALVAALVHDLGHGPFSHVFERVSGIDHEAITQQIILDDQSQVHRILMRHEKTLPQRVAETLRGDGTRTFIHDILCSQLDADRCDYLLRDNLMTGARYGDFDLHWLMHALTIDQATGRMAVMAKGISAVEAYLQSRYHMYRNVYFHKVVRSAEGMVKLALQRAKRLAVQDRLVWPTKSDPVSKALSGQRLSVGEFTEMDDISVLHCFKLWQSSDDPLLSRLCTGLLYRRLYKSVDVSHISDARRMEEVLSVCADVITKAGGEEAYELFFDQPADTPYQTDEEAPEILIQDEMGKLRSFTSISPLTRVLKEQLMFHRIHCAPEWREMVVRVVGT